MKLARRTQYISRYHYDVVQEYMMSDAFDEDIERILRNDSTISRKFARDCAIEQFLDGINEQ